MSDCKPFRHPVNVCNSSCRSFVTIATNTEEIWPCPSAGSADPRTDGWWGPHEYAVLPQSFDRSSPYLAWIPSLNSYNDLQFFRYSGIDPTIIRLDFMHHPLVPVSGYYHPVPPTAALSRYPCSSLPSKPTTATRKTTVLDFCSASDAMICVVKTQVDDLINRVRPLITQLDNDPDTRFVRPPEQALFYLQQARYWNSLPRTNTERGHRLILGGMKRAAMELHGFILWHRDHRLSVDERPMVRKHQKWFRTRGAFVNNEDDYAFLAKRDIPVWMNIAVDAFQLPRSARPVSLTAIPIHCDLMFPRGHKDGHHTAIFFYPPKVDDNALFELAARGYAGRLDIYQLNTQIANVHEKMHRDKSTLYRECRAKSN
jgi:hypothetical protein